VGWPFSDFCSVEIIQYFARMVVLILDIVDAMHEEDIGSELQRAEMRPEVILPCIAHKRGGVAFQV
jgi:hypothetical protein